MRNFHFRFDGQFIMSWILEQGITPEIIPCGSKLMAITHPVFKIRIIDSLNFMPMALSRLPACFGVTEEKKGFFPHLFNVQENQNYIGPFPDKKYYSPDTMSSSTRSEFLEWYEDNKEQQFDFQKEMLEYCQ